MVWFQKVWGGLLCSNRYSEQNLISASGDAPITKTKSVWDQLVGGEDCSGKLKEIHGDCW